MDILTTSIPLLMALSVSTERFVEITKQLVPFLNQANPDPVIEGRRKAALQVLAVVAGIITVGVTWATNPTVIPVAFQSTIGVIALGLLASGGSGFWNSISTYFLQLKNLKQVDVDQKTQQVAAIKAENALAMPARAA